MKRSTLKLWGIPLFMSLLLLYGLISALVMEGAGDVLACLVMLIPVLTILYKYYFQTGFKNK